MADNPFKPPAVATVGQKDDVRKGPGKFSWGSLLVSVVVWCISYLVGSEAAFGSNPTLLTLLLATISSIWVYHDAKRNRVKIVGAVNFLIFFVWMFAVPIYLIYTRGKIGWCWAIVQAVGVCGAWYLGWQSHS